MDNEIEEFAKSENITCFRGNSFDVLDRYYQCAKFFHLETIVRISGDAPLIDPSIVDKTIQLFKKSDFEYVNNFNWLSTWFQRNIEEFNNYILTSLLIILLFFV